MVGWRDTCGDPIRRDIRPWHACRADRLPLHQGGKTRPKVAVCKALSRLRQTIVQKVLPSGPRFAVRSRAWTTPRDCHPIARM